LGIARPEKLQEIRPVEQGREEQDKHLLQAAWTPAPPALKGKRTEPSVNMKSDAGSLLRKSAAGSEREAYYQNVMHYSAYREAYRSNVMFKYAFRSIFRAAMWPSG